MAIDTPIGRTRRAVLMGALGGFGAVLAHAIGGASPVAAATGDPLLLGKGDIASDNAATATTWINSDANPIFGAKASTETAISGETTIGTGVAGLSTSGIAVGGTSSGGVGVFGVSSTGAAVVGQATGPGTLHGRSTGVTGYTGDGSSLPLDGTNETGVYGFSNDSVNSTGVWGDSFAGTGVAGTGDWGVFGTGREGVVGIVGATGTGIHGFAGATGFVGGPAGVGVYAAAGSTSQTALQVSGKIKLSRSGRKAIGSTATSLKVAMSGVTTSSYVVATLQTSVSGCYVRAVVCATGSFTIYLSKAPGKTAYIGYVVIN